jgi:hypothetical protein
MEVRAGLGRRLTDPLGPGKARALGDTNTSTAAVPTVRQPEE